MTLWTCKCSPFLIGAILAYLGKPLVHWAAGRGIARALSTTVVVLLFGSAQLPKLAKSVGLAKKEFEEAKKPDVAN